MTDDIQKVREAYEAAVTEAYDPAGLNHGEAFQLFVAALAKRLQPRPTPEKKVWRVSDATGSRFGSVYSGAFYAVQLNEVAPDIIRERPDLVKADLKRRLAKARTSYNMLPMAFDAIYRDLFPELDP